MPLINEAKYANKWDLRFLKLAHEVSLWSKDPSTQCGAVVVNSRKRVLSCGYNGFPEGCDDHPSIYANREVKYSRVIHAEMNAFLEIGRQEGSTLYTWPFMTCDRCAVHMIGFGVKRVVAPFSDNERWKETFERAYRVYNEAGVRFDLYDPALFTWSHTLAPVADPVAPGPVAHSEKRCDVV